MRRWTCALTIAAIAYFVGAFDPSELAVGVSRDGYMRHLAVIDVASLGRTVEARFISRHDDRLIDLVPVPYLERSFDPTSNPEVAVPARHIGGLPSLAPQRGPPALASR